MEISLIGKVSDFGTDLCRFESYISNINKLNINYLKNRMNCRNVGKHLTILMKYTKPILLLLSKFKYEGLLNSFSLIGYNTLRIFFSYPGCMTVFRYIKFNFKNKLKASASFKAINYFLRNNYSMLYFSTSFGILSSEEIFRYRTGGYILCAIYS